MAKKGDWVRIHRVVLPAEGRNPNLPADTAKVPLEMWVKGTLCADAEIGDEVEVVFRKIREEGKEGVISYGYKFKLKE